MVSQNAVPVTIMIDSDSRLWKGELLSLQAVELGDYIYCRGVPVDNATVRGLKLWVNIVNFYGKVEESQPTSFTARVYVHAQASDMVIPVELSPVVLVDEQPVTTFANIQPNTYIQVLGVLLRNGVVRATRIWIGSQA